MTPNLMIEQLAVVMNKHTTEITELKEKFTQLFNSYKTLLDKYYALDSEVWALSSDIRNIDAKES